MLQAPRAVMHGSDMNEGEAFAHLIDKLGESRDAARAIGLLRSDLRWLTVAKHFDLIRDNAIKLFRSRLK